MKSKTLKNPTPVEPDEETVRDYARHLYEQSGRLPGRDLENWLEAKRCVEASMQLPRSAHRGSHGNKVQVVTEICASPIEAQHLVT